MARNQATGQEAGAVYVSVMPSGQGFGRSMDSQLTGSFNSAQSKGTASFSRFFAKVAAAGAAVLAGIGLKNLVKSTIDLGVSYNVLEQSSKAAFTTLLGTADAAAAMQKQIREFAMTSPFPRQAFIEGSQQLLAFGVEASKVVPILGAVQDAVAAAGGSSQQLQDVIFIMAQIKAAGKITGQDLLQFGQRGINAAELIGSAMGKTGTQIKESITKGTLSADDALDALTKGMDAKFGGAAANLKGTFVGARDRIKGAWRDLSSELVAPFVDPNGGGYAVAWANKFADLLRTIQASSGFAKVKVQLADFGKTLDPIVGKATELVGLLFQDHGRVKFFAALAQIPELTPFTYSLLAISHIFEKLAPVAPALGDALLKVAEALLSKGVIDALTELAVTLLPPLADLLVAIAPLIPPIAQFLALVLVPALKEVTTDIRTTMSAFTALFKLLTGDTSAQDYLSSILGYGGLIGGAFEAVVNAILFIINAAGNAAAFSVNTVINLMNTLLQTTADVFNAVSGVLHLPQIKLPTRSNVSFKPLSMKSIKGLADSGTILPRPGGTLIRAAEAGRAESVVDTGKLNDLMDAAGGRGSDRPIVMDGSIIGILRTLASGEAQLVFNQKLTGAYPAKFGRA